MSCVQTASRLGAPSSCAASAASEAQARLAGARFRRFVRAVTRWMERANQRRALAELDWRLLDDIGVTREAASREATKPFWRD
jgi:uncharacterized protein YjiS (DUF1127 family)